MHEALIVALCVIMGALVIWSMLRAFKTGTISSRGSTFQIEESPLGFVLTVVSRLVILAGCVWFALHTLGVANDLPMSWLRR